MTETIQIVDETLLAFEKARFEYCEKAFEREVERKESLEKRAQFHLSFITLILGGLFFNLDLFDILGNSFPRNPTDTTVTYIIYVCLTISALSLLLTLIAILQIMAVQPYMTPYPFRIITSLFSPETKYYERRNEISFINATATSYAIALEVNRKVNAAKATWIKVSSYSIFIIILSLVIIFSMTAYLRLHP